MEVLQILFDLFVVLGFCSAVVDHWFVGRGFIRRPLRAFMLGCFAYSEAYLAVTAQPMLALYVLLNAWGLANLYLGRRAPLRSNQ